MQIIKNAQGKLETVGSADDEARSEAAIRAKIAEDRAALRRMLEGNEQFFEDPMAKPVEIKPDETSWKNWLPKKPGVYIACTQEQASSVFSDPSAMIYKHFAHFNGSFWTIPTASIENARELSRKVRFFSGQICWLYLVEAD